MKKRQKLAMFDLNLTEFIEIFHQFVNQDIKQQMSCS